MRIRIKKLSETVKIIYPIDFGDIWLGKSLVGRAFYTGGQGQGHELQRTVRNLLFFSFMRINLHLSFNGQGPNYSL